MSLYNFKATFGNKNYPEGYGEVEANTKEEAIKVVFGRCGSWFDEDGRSFDAGCPYDVEIIEK